MQLPIKKFTFSTLAQMAGQIIWNTPQHKAQELRQPVLYLTLDKMPMGVFLDCLCDGNLSSLVVSGQAPNAELLEENWNNTLLDYHELKGDTQNNETFKLSRQIRRLRHHLVLLQHALDLLRLRWSEPAAMAINKLGYSFRPENKAPEAYSDELKAIAARSRRKFVELEQLIKELEVKTKAETDDGAKPKRENFESLIVEVEALQKVAYDLETMLVPKYLRLEKKYYAHVQKMLNQTNGK